MNDLTHILPSICPMQARRCANLTGVQKEMATLGIVRHLRAVAKLSANEITPLRPCPSTIREIIDDAKDGKSFALEMENDSREYETAGRSSTLAGGRISFVLKKPRR